jgi:hypothetical protein
MRSKREFLKVTQLAAKGHCDQEIERITGIPRRTVSGWRRGETRLLERSRCAGYSKGDHDFSKLPSGAYAYLLGLYLGDGCISANHRGSGASASLLTPPTPASSPSAALHSRRSSRPRLRGGVCGAAATAVTSRCGRSIGPASFLSTVPGASICDQSAWSLGRRRSWGRIASHSSGADPQRRHPNRRHRAQGLLCPAGAPRYAFSNKSEDIKRLFCESCDALGVRWTRPSDCQIAIYRKESVARLDEFVGPKR